MLLLFSAGQSAAQVNPDGNCYRYSNTNVPYGHYHFLKRSGTYGDKSRVETAQEAVEIVKGFYSEKNMRAGQIIEKPRFFRIVILDGDSNIIDIVIIDKRSGRIRSIY